MKIVKRDGRTVDYNRDKIKLAIDKANKEVTDENKIDDGSIEEIIAYIESLDKKRMLVEDIQDIIEFKLMEKGKFVLAKKYIIYRYKRSIIRQTNTTDASILSLLKNGETSKGNYLVANRQRDIMAGEASKDIAYRLLLPKNVVNAEKLNRIKFCHVEHFTEPIVESIKLDLEKMYDSETVINNIKIDRPKNFQSACNILMEIINSISQCQTGNIYIELKDLFPYYDLLYEKKYAMYKSLLKTELSIEQIRALSETQSFLEIKAGIQTIYYQLNTLFGQDGQAPKLYFLINPNEISSEHDEKLVYEFIKEKITGLITADNFTMIPKYPAIIYYIDSEDYESKKFDYITDELINSNIGYIIMNSRLGKNFNKYLLRFNQGSMILNLARLALDFINFTEFKDALLENLGYIYEGFLCRNHNLQGVYSNKSPIHWQYGGIARLENMEKIDYLLKKEYSYMNLVVIGFEAAVKILNGANNEKKEIKNIIMNFIAEKNNESSFDIVLSNYYEEEVINKLFNSDCSDLKKYGISSYYDSLDFMKKDYFSDGLLYYTYDNSNKIEIEDILNNNIIFQKLNK